MHTNFTIRMSPEERHSLSELARRTNEALGIDVTSSDLVRLALRRLPADPAVLFKLPAEGPRR
jgi:hypothetical protein